MGEKERGVDVQLRSFLDSALDGGEFATASSDRFARVRGPRIASQLLNRRLGGP